MPSHCSAPHASNRSSSVNPSFAARRIERTLAVWVASITGSPGSASANQPSAAAHASAAYPNQRVPPEKDLADHRPVEIDHEMPGAPLGHLRRLAPKLVTRAGTAEVGVHLWRGQQLDVCGTVPSLGRTEHEPLGPDRGRRPGDGSELSHGGQFIADPPGGPEVRAPLPNRTCSLPNGPRLKRASAASSSTASSRRIRA